MFETDPDDHDDALFHEQFGGLRNVFIDIARDLASRVKGRVAAVERTPPRVSEVVFGGVAEVVNVLARFFGAEEPEEPDDG